ncbi:unnamed protein product, partial [Didymodactylos carnosus]
CTNFYIPQTHYFKNGYALQKYPCVGIDHIYKSGLRLTEEEQQLLDNFSPELIYGKAKVKVPDKFVPATVFYDKKVLRFYGYFKQTIYESPLEYYRVRRVIIYYYLEDDSMAIYEIPYKNSALWQGMRVRRHRFPKTDQHETYNWRDLNLSQNVAVYGTVYRICDCDKFTKEWLESEGIVLNCSELLPVDPYTQKMIDQHEKEKTHGHSDLQEILPNMFIQTEIGNKQFNQLDRKILRFFAVLDERDQLYGDLRKFIIHFYLIDNTVEIREIHEENDGYDPYPVYLNRQIIPKDSAYNINSYVNLFVNSKEKKKICYLIPKDFCLGKNINIFNRLFFLYNCDIYTKSFYHQNFQMFDFTPIEVDLKKFHKRIKLPPIPPHNMFGKPEDTIQNVKHLVPKPIKRDQIKLMENENRVLRYEAMMDTPREEDRRRRFIISYRVADDQISVYERPLDGHSVLSRKFLERVRIPKPGSHPDAPCYYGPHDFYIDAIVEFFKHRFIIIDADLYVLKFIEENKHQFPQHVIDSLRKKLCHYDNSNKNDGNKRTQYNYNNSVEQTINHQASLSFHSYA